MMLVVSEARKQAWPGAAVGVLAMDGLANPKGHPELERRKAALEEKLRAEGRKRIEAKIDAAAFDNWLLDLRADGDEELILEEKSA